MEELVGTFWTGNYAHPVFKTLIKGLELINQQTEQDIQTLTNCLGLKTTPLYHRYLWYPLVLQKNNFYVPEGLRDIGCIQDNIGNPTFRWLKDKDFTLKYGALTFKHEIFKTDEVSKILWLKDADFDERYLSRFWGALVGIDEESSEEYRDILKAAYKTKIEASYAKV